MLLRVIKLWQIEDPTAPEAIDVSYSYILMDSAFPQGNVAIYRKGVFFHRIERMKKLLALPNNDGEQTLRCQCDVVD